MESKVIATLKGIKKVVYDRLINNERDRNNDEVLCGNIWYYELKSLGYDMEKMSAMEFMRLKINGSLTQESSIKRERRLLNQNYPETRGLSYNNRKNEEELVRKQIHEV